MNNVDKHPMDDFFRAHLGEATQAPPSWAWDRLASSLDAKKRRKAFVWWRIAAAAALLLLAFSAGYMLSGSQEQSPGLAAEQNQALPFDVSRQEDKNTDDRASLNTVNKSTKEAENEQNTIDLPVQQIPLNKIDRPLSRISINENDIIPPSSNLAEASYSLEKMNPRTSGEILYEDDKVVMHFRTDYLAISLNPFYFSEEGKSDDPNTEEEIMWRFGGDLAPLLAFRSTGSFADADKYENSNLTTQSVLPEGGNERPLMAFSAGLHSSIAIGRGLDLFTGLHFTRLGQETENPGLVYSLSSFSSPTTSALAITSAGNIELNETDIQTLSTDFSSSNALASDLLIQQFEYLELPLILSKRLLDKQIILRIEGGISAGLLISNRSFFQEGTQRYALEGTSGLRPLLWSGVAGFGLSIPFADDWEIGLRPGFRYAFTSINYDRAYTYRPWSISLGTGISYTLK